MRKTEEGRSLFIQACHCLFDCKEPDLKQQGLLLLKKAVEQEDPLALCLLGDFYLYGKKGLLPKDVEKSTACYIQAWNLIAPDFEEEKIGNIDWSYAADVCLCMGTIFLYGRCQVEDYELAEEFFRNAAYGFDLLLKKGDAKAEKKLEKASKLFIDARTKKAQLTEAIHIYDKATLKAKPFTAYPFRAVHRSIMDAFSADLNRLLCEKTGVEYTGDNESFFYCYADEEAGLTLRALGFYNRGSKVSYQEIPESTPILFRYDIFKNWQVSMGVIAPCVYRRHRDQCGWIMQNYEKNQTIMKACLDPLRSPEFPYDIQAVLFNSTQAAEQVWYRPIEMRHFTLKGILLNEPYGAFGIHRGNIVYAHLAFQGGKEIVFIQGFADERHQNNN